MIYRLDRETHTHFIDGHSVPSVTGIIDACGLVSPFCKNDAAAQRGQNGHLLCQLCYSGEIEDWEVPEISRPWITAIRQFMEDFKIAPLLITLNVADLLAVEFPVWSKLGYAGIPDLLTDDLTLWENKFWSSISKQGLDNAGIQTAGYALAIKERLGITVKKRKAVIYNIDKSRPYEVRDLNDPSDLPVFIGALNVYKRLSLYQNLSVEDIQEE